MRDAPSRVKEEAARSGGVGRSLIRAANEDLAAVTRLRTVPRAPAAARRKPRAFRGVDVDPTKRTNARGPRGRERMLHMEAKSVTAQIGNQSITIETGRMAKQSDGSVVVRAGDSVVLVTAVSAKEKREGLDFFPLTVD